MPGLVWKRWQVTVLMCAVVVCTAPLLTAQTSNGFVPVTDGMLQDPESAVWLMWRRTLDG